MEIICLSGYARSGKDTAAQVLVDEFGFTKIAFADKLRDALYALNPIVAHGWQVKGKDYPLEPVYLCNVIDRFGWDGYKETLHGREVRRLLQRMGTEAVRDTIGKDVWIDAALNGLDENAKVVISDGRFFNEFDAVRDRGGLVWRIERSGIGAASNHPSELEALSYPFDYTLWNTGSIEELRNGIRGLYGIQSVL